ncbi:MAG: hypothetical protein LAT54_03260 [Cryomorphaceae bacterium]|nr:hypothetical protein [Cryomorphaceae bacterium]
MTKRFRKTKLRSIIYRSLIKTDIPLIVYGVVLLSMILLWRYRHLNEDLALNFFSELFGAAFTLFIIDVLLVREKRKRWKAVRRDLDYLIARNVNRMRDGIASRIFKFKPVISIDKANDQGLALIIEQRGALLDKLAGLSQSELMVRIDEKELYSEASYDYFNEKANDLWEIINVPYADFFHPELVSYIVQLHINIKDLCGHIRQYLKGNNAGDDIEWFRSIGSQGASVSLSKIINILNALKNEGYSEAATLELKKTNL